MTNINKQEVIIKQLNLCLFACFLFFGCHARHDSATPLHFRRYSF